MAGFIMAGRIQAAVFIVLSTLISLVMPPLLVFSNATIALITLRKGWQQGIIYTLLASATLIVVIMLRTNQHAGNGLITGLVNWLPIVLIASALAITRSWGKTLQLTLLLGIAGILLFHVTHPDAVTYWTSVLERLKPQLKNYQFSDFQIDEMISSVAGWMTGLSAAVLVLISVTSLIIARNWQALLYNPGGFGTEFRQISISKPTAMVVLAGIVVAIFTNNHLIIELLMVGIVIFMFQGLSLAHAFIKQRELPIGWLIGLYILMFLLFIQMIVLLAAFGIIDSLVDFRRKFANKE